MLHPGLLAFAITFVVIAAGGRAAFGAVTAQNYVTAAAATEQCAGRRLSMIEEMRLAQLMRREGIGTASSLDVSDTLGKARSERALACDAPDVQEQIKAFTQTVLPQLQGPAK